MQRFWICCTFLSWSNQEGSNYVDYIKYSVLSCWAGSPRTHKGDGDGVSGLEDSRRKVENNTGLLVESPISLVFTLVCQHWIDQKTQKIKVKKVKTRKDWEGLMFLLFNLSGVFENRTRTTFPWGFSFLVWCGHIFKHVNSFLG